MVGWKQGKEFGMAKILVAEDDKALAIVLRNVLRGDSHEVDVAHDGESALELIENYIYDLVVLDWDLPKVNGLEVCKRYRKEGGQLPVLFLTGKSDIAFRVQGLESGADDYLCKPFSTEELLARLKALLRRRGEPARMLLSAGAVTLDPLSKKVTVNGTEVDLSRKELAILEFLMRHPNQVFSIEAIVERVWSSLSEVSPETVRPYIKRMRDKLMEAGGECPIVTVHGSGYLLKK